MPSQPIEAGVGRVPDFVRERRRCSVRSESPLRIPSGDSTTVVEVEPVNALARVLWGEVVRRTREICHLELLGAIHGQSLS